jgi:hypothetical protein
VDDGIVIADEENDRTDLPGVGGWDDLDAEVVVVSVLFVTG